MYRTSQSLMYRTWCTEPHRAWCTEPDLQNLTEPDVSNLTEPHRTSQNRCHTGLGPLSSSGQSCSFTCLWGWIMTISNMLKPDVKFRVCSFTWSSASLRFRATCTCCWERGGSVTLQTGGSQCSECGPVPGTRTLCSECKCPVLCSSRSLHVSLWRFWRCGAPETLVWF